MPSTTKDTDGMQTRKFSGCFSRSKCFVRKSSLAPASWGGPPILTVHRLERSIRLLWIHSQPHCLPSFLNILMGSSANLNKWALQMMTPGLPTVYLLRPPFWPCCHLHQHGSTIKMTYWPEASVKEFQASLPDYALNITINLLHPLMLWNLKTLGFNPTFYTVVANSWSI